MTKLMQWVFGVHLFFAVYMAIIFRKIENQLFDKWMFEIEILPLILIVLFGVYAVATVLYRSLTVMDCADAAKELQLQMKQARIELTSKGFKFRDDK